MFSYTAVKRCLIIQLLFHVQFFRFCLIKPYSSSTGGEKQREKAGMILVEEQLAQLTAQIYI